MNDLDKGMIRGGSMLTIFVNQELMQNYVLIFDETFSERYIGTLN